MHYTNTNLCHSYLFNLQATLAHSCPSNIFAHIYVRPINSKLIEHFVFLKTYFKACFTCCSDTHQTIQVFSKSQLGRGLYECRHTSYCCIFLVKVFRKYHFLSLEKKLKNLEMLPWSHT